MNLISSIFVDFFYQSNHFLGSSESTRSKRIQNIFKNCFVLNTCLFGYVTVRAIILFIEPSSFGTTISFSIFLPLMFLTNLKLTLYVRKNQIARKKDYAYSFQGLDSYENHIGFYSSLLSFWVITLIPFTIYYENDKFDKGVQFMMSKIFLNFTDIILMQPKKHAQFCEILFTLIYFIILSMKSFSFVNLFFASAASISTYFIFYIADQMNREYSRYKKKEDVLKLNDEIFKIIEDPILIINSSLNRIIFKNQAYIDLQNLMQINDEIGLMTQLRSDTNVSLLESIQKEFQNFFQNPNSETSIYSASLKKNNEKKIAYHVKKVRKKLKNVSEEVIAIYFHYIGNEIEKKILQQNIEFTNLMLYSLSHEIRTPLNGMQGILLLIKNQMEHKFNLQIKIALSCSEFLVSQINCMLDYSQIIKKEFKLHLESLEIRPYLNKLKKIAKSNLVNKKSLINFQVDVSSKISERVILDPERVKQVFLNLITNSIKHTEAGFIKISAELNTEDELVLSLADSGRGFTPEQVKLFNENKANIFINYDQTKQIFPGYKLSICQILVNKFKSTLTINSTKECGSTFSFALSMTRLKLQIEKDVYKRRPSGTLLEVDKSPRINLSKYNYSINITKTMSSLNSQTSVLKIVEYVSKFIIIADDVELNRFVISGMVKKLNFDNILEASNGKEALDFAKQKNREKAEFLIFMDIDMPVLNGIESTKLIREFSSQPIVAVTAFIGEEVRNRAKLAGVDQFVTKPITFTKIKMILKEYNYI